MLNTVLFDMGGTLEDIWYNEDTIDNVMKKLQETLTRIINEGSGGLICIIL